MKHFTLLWLLLLGTALQAQNFQWLKTQQIDFSLNHDMIGYTTTCDSSGNVYFTGFKGNAVPGNADIVGDMFFNKYAPDGQLLFSKLFTGSATAYNMVTDSQGNVILAMGYYTALTIGDLQLSDTTASSMKHIIVKLDPQGNLLWYEQLTIDGFDFEEVGSFVAIAVDAADDIYAGYDNFMWSYITKYSPDGDAISTIVQQDVNRITSLAVDSLGNIYAAGSCGQDTASFAGVSAPSVYLPYNTYLVKYSAAGAYQWVKYVDDETCPNPQVVLHGTDAIYFSSMLFGPYNFDEITLQGPGDNEDMYLAKVNAAGQYQWVREAPAGGTLSMGKRNFLGIDTSGNVYLSGRTWGAMDWGGGITTPGNGFGNNDAIVLKYDADGNVLMAKTGGGASEDRIDGIAVNSEGEIYLSGVGIGNGIFGGLTHTGQNPFQAYPFLAKVGEGTMGTAQPLNQTAALYPNPAEETLHIQGVGHAWGSIINLMGQRVKEFETHGDTAIDLADMAAGAYLLHIAGYAPMKFIKK